MFEQDQAPKVDYVQEEKAMLRKERAADVLFAAGVFVVGFMVTKLFLDRTATL